MNKLARKIQHDYAGIQNLANSLFQVYADDIGQMIEVANKDCIQTLVAGLSHYDEINYKTLLMHGSLANLSSILQRRYQNLAVDMENYWSDKRKDFDLLSRLASNFIAIKASPPWIKSTLNLKDSLSTDGVFDPRKGHFSFYMKNMVDMIMKEVERGSLASESLSKILGRVRRLFDRKNKRGVREIDQRSRFTDDENEEGTQFSLGGPPNIEEGVFTIEDIDYFYSQQQRANQWESRQYRPWFSDSVKANNRWLRDLEQLLMSDAVNQLHSGMMQIGSEEMGIDDMQWVVSRPQPTCDECTDRDGLMMKEIADKMKDEFGDQVPPLHPNCKCQLVPKIKDDWADKQLQGDDNDSWNPDDGTVYSASDQEKSAGISDMTFEEYLKQVRGLN